MHDQRFALHAALVRQIQQRRARSLALGVLVAAMSLASACGGGGTSTAVAKSDVARTTPSATDQANAKTLAADNNAFAVDLYGLISKGDGNVLYSPYSVSEALAMLYAGARGETASEMEQVLHIGELKDQVHPAFNALDQELRPQSAGSSGSFRLSVANAAWGEQAQKFETAYLDTLAKYYGAGVQLADFQHHAESARSAINDWVASQTQQRIKDLMPKGSVTSDTRLVLANAIYFKADWAQKFQAEQTAKGAFKLEGGGTVQADFMHQSGSFGYATSGGTQVVEIPYAGGKVAMDLLVPAEGQFAAFESGLSSSVIGTLVGSLQSTGMSLAVPKFSFTSEVPMKDVLQSLGMKTVFVAGQADLSGMDGQRDLYVSGVYHKAFIKVDEQGTEAAAATGISVGATAMPATMVSVDRPFVFLIRDRESGAILFAGRALDPTK